jgi:hypothetical protein
MTPRFLLIQLVTMTALAGPLAAEELSPVQPSPDEMAKEAGITLPPRPWHLADLWWDLAEPTANFESLSIDVTIDRDVPSDYNLYVAPVGIAQINGMDFYGGLQTNINGWDSKESRTRVHPGKGAIFSRWSHDKTTPIGLSHVRMAAGGLCESAGYEGEFCSVRRPFAWTAGTYTYSIVKGDTSSEAGSTNTWFHCLVRTHATGLVTWIGSLRFEGTQFTYWNRHSAFVEVYATSKIPKSGIPKVNVTFGYPMINGRAPGLKGSSVVHPIKGSAAAPPCATARAEGSKVLVEVGPIAPRKPGMDQHRLDVIKP